MVAVAIWYLLEHTATGRRLYATGFNPDAARLAGVRIDRLRFMSLVASGGLAGATGIVLASTLGSGSPSAGTPYLLPAFAAAFLGATQLKHGRFNAGGTIIAVLLLGTGVTGLALANAPQWAGDMFVGVVLIAALALTGLQRRTTAGRDGRPTAFISQPATGGVAHVSPWPEEARVQGAALLVLGAALAGGDRMRQQRLGRLGRSERWRRRASPRRRRWPRRRRRGRRPSGSRQPIGKPVPTGKKVVFISCGVQACEIQGNIIKQGAADLGWTASTIGTDGSPEQLQNAFETALAPGRRRGDPQRRQPRQRSPSRSRRPSSRAWRS